MEEWKRLEFEHAKRLREYGTTERRKLYSKAYSAVASLAMKRKFASNAPEDRTAGTSKKLVEALIQICDKNDDVIEIGCGRGYTCMLLAPHVKSIVGTDISDPVLAEASAVLLSCGITNVEIKRVSAFNLTHSFAPETFKVALSIDVVEHLHPEDANEHLRQVFELLKPGGKYIIVMPNRLSGPHDITRQEFPDAKKPLGFHLNESTYYEMTKIMKKIAYRKFQSFVYYKFTRGQLTLRLLPLLFCIAIEKLFIMLPDFLRHREFDKLLYIRLIAHKPG